MIKMSVPPGALHLNVAYFPGLQTLGKMMPERAGGNASRFFLVPALPAPFSRWLGEKADLAGDEACLWVCTGQCHLDGKLPPCVWPLSCFMKIFLFSSLSYSSREVGHFKRSAVTLIVCFQKAHEQNLETYGCAELAYQLHSLTSTEENDV